LRHRDRRVNSLFWAGWGQSGGLFSFQRNRGNCPSFNELFLSVDGRLVGIDTMLLAAAGSCVCTGTTMHIQSIIAGTIKGKIGKVTVTIFDDCGNPVPAAEVTGTFLEGNFDDETGSGVTNANGVAAILTTAEVKKPTYKFCVDDVVKGTLTYEPNDNVEDCEIK